MFSENCSYLLNLLIVYCFFVNGCCNSVLLECRNNNIVWKNLLYIMDRDIIKLEKLVMYVKFVNHIIRG